MIAAGFEPLDPDLPRAAPVDASDRSPARPKREFRDGALAAGRTANAVLNGLADAAGISPYVESHPYGLVAAAIGSGYVAGGGLFTPTTARLLGMAFKLAAIPAVRDRLLDAADAALDALSAAPTPRSTRTSEVTP